MKLLRYLQRPLDVVLGWILSRRLKLVAGARRGDPRVSPSERDPRVFVAQEELIRRHAPGRSFVDIGCLWEMDGACAFLAEEAGATAVTAMDKWPASERFSAEHDERASGITYVEADLHDEAALEKIGVHDVVWCSGLMYHTPVPFTAIAQLLSLMGELLICGTKTLPSVPGLPGLAAYYPGLTERDRATYGATAPPVAAQPFEPDGFFRNWYWGLSPDALVALARSIANVEVVEEVHLPWGLRCDDYYVVLRRLS